jgi:phosphatidylglycerophosphate synthase
VVLDWVDGYVARVCDQRSVFGAFLDVIVSSAGVASFPFVLLCLFCYAFCFVVSGANNVNVSSFQLARQIAHESSAMHCLRNVDSCCLFVLLCVLFRRRE